MSISTNSTNSGEFSSDDYEMNYDELSILKEGAVVKTNSESFTDKQQLKEFTEKFAKMELVLKNTKLELKNKGLQEKLKQQETNALLAKIEAENGKMKNEIEKMKANFDKKEQQLEKKEEKMEKNLEELQKKLVEMEQQKQDEQKKSIDQMEKMLQTKADAYKANDKLKNEHKEMEEKVDKLEEQLGRKLKKLEEEALLNFRQNCWDAKACQNELEITKLTVHCHKGKCYVIRTAFATHPILLNKDFSKIFYFEISVKNMSNSPLNLLSFGFAAKQQKKLEGTLANELGTFAYLNIAFFTINDKWIYQKAQIEYSFKQNDIVGCGINLATRQIFFTKNGQRRGPFYLIDNSPNSVHGDLFPFVSFYAFGDKIQANFGPIFKFIWILFEESKKKGRRQYFQLIN